MSWVAGRLTRWRLLPLACAVALCCQGALHGQTLRTWKDATGRFRVEASLVGQDDGVVRLRKADGSTISVPLDKLSSSDRRFVLTQARGEQAAARRSAERSPAAPEVASAKPAATRNAVRAETLCGVNWFKPDEVGVAAGAGQKTQKPVMWFRVLGDLNGFM